MSNSAVLIVRDIPLVRFVDVDNLVVYEIEPARL